MPQPIPDHFIPTANAAELTKRTAEVLLACSSLMEVLIPELPAEKQAILQRTIDGGGRVGLQLTVDRRADNLVSVVALDPSGLLRAIATVARIGTPAAVAGRPN